MEVPLPAWREHPGDGPVMLLIHGFLSSSSQWLDNLDALGRVCRPVTLDLWGHGASGAPSEPQAYSPEGYVQALEAIRRKLGTQRWFLCGYSLGAGITIRYALAYPERVIGHVFTNSTSALADAEQIAAWRATAEAAASRIETGGRQAIEAIPVHPRHAKRLPCRPSSLAAPGKAASSHTARIWPPTCPNSALPISTPVTP
jgi:pimeloyl-ACP methyl ester carboxylesterase